MQWSNRTHDGRSSRAVGVALACAAAVLAPPAIGAEEAVSAKLLFDDAIERMQSADYDRACPALAQSQALDPHPGTLFALADCEAFRHHRAAAYARYGEYLNVYATLPREKQLRQGTRPKEASEKRAELERALVEVTLALPPDAPDGTTVTLDDVLLGADSLDAPARLDPGAHVVVTLAPGHFRTVQRFTVAEGEKLALTLRVGSLATHAPERVEDRASNAHAPVAAAPGDLHRTTAFVAGGVGAAGLVLGTITGALMLSKQGAIAEGCRDAGSGVAKCTTAGADAGNSAKALGAVATVGFVTALVGAGVAIVAITTRPSDGGDNARSARRGRIELGALGVGSSGMILGARGRL
jgi:hypothetical protein